MLQQKQLSFIDKVLIVYGYIERVSFRLTWNIWKIEGPWMIERPSPDFLFYS